MPEDIIIDTDPGQDDALAILIALAASDRLAVKAITTVAGNVPVALTTANALHLVELAGRTDVPVHAGAEAPLLFPLETAEHVCGPDGLAGSGLPPATGRPAPGHAVEAIIAIARASADAALTLCPLGPLTNIALALRLAPDIKHKVKRVVLMGGALTLGNITPAAEYNIYVDPHAAEIVFASGLPIVMLGLDLTHQAVATDKEIAAIGALSNRAAKAVHGMITRPRPHTATTEGHPQHDPCVIAYLLWPEIFTGKDCFVEVETSAGSQRGRTTIDWHDRLKRAPNAHVVERIDAPAFFRNVTEELARLP